MSTARTILMIVILLGLAACASGALTPEMPGPRVAALHGSSLDGIAASATEESVTVSFAGVPGTGQFIRLGLAPGQYAAVSTWEGADEALKLVVPTAGGADIGIVPLNGGMTDPVTLTVALGPAPRSSSIPPVGAYNVITDLSVTDAGGGGVTLEWTQVNIGDYDLNSEVNLADLVPIALHFNETYDRQAPGADETTEYWVDGDGNGEINASDVTPIGQNYNALVAGYNIYRDDQLIPGPVPGGPTVPASEGIERTGLPPQYAKTVTGLLTDAFRVAAVDAEGIEGADSSGNAGPVDLLANIDIDGQLLLDILNGQNPGAFGPGKITTRVIDPIEINNSIQLGDVTQTTAELAQVRNLPRDQALYLQFLYIPAVDLGTGVPKGTVSVHSSSALEDEIVVTSIPIRLPTGLGAVEVTASIDLGQANPSGGYFTYLHTEIKLPGNPVTQIIDKRLDNANGLIAADSDMNGDFEDEPHIEDADLDCASESLRENELDGDEYEFEERDELNIEGIVSSFDEVNGTIVLINTVLEVGDLEIPLPDPVTLLFNELTQFEEKVKTSGEDLEQDLDPSTITNGDELHVDLYRLSDDTGPLPDKYWAEKVERKIDLT